MCQICRSQRLFQRGLTSVICCAIVTCGLACHSNSGDQYRTVETRDLSGDIAFTPPDSAASAPQTPPASTPREATSSPTIDTPPPGPDSPVRETPPIENRSPTPGDVVSAGPADSAASDRSRGIRPAGLNSRDVEEFLRANPGIEIGPDGLPIPPKPLPGGIQLLIPHREFPTVDSGGRLRLTYDDLDLLKILNMAPVPLNAVDYFPAWLNALDGQPVRIRGYMFPTLRQTGITVFQLARDNQVCCFGPQGQVYDLIGVELAPGETTHYRPARPFDVEGIFHIDPFGEGDDLEEIYRITSARILQ